MILSYKYRLYPSNQQKAQLTTMLGSLCDLYNAGLQQRIEAYQRHGRTLRYVEQSAELKAVRAADDILGGLSFSTEQQVLRRLDKAFRAFFGRLKKGGKAGFPRFRAKSMFDSAEMRVGDGLTIRKSKRLRITGIDGEIKVKWHRDIPNEAELGAAVVSRANGRWYICFQIELPNASSRTDFAPIGIDLGLTSLVALSNGETIATPQITKRAAKGLRRRARALSRCKRGSKRRAKVRLLKARYEAKAANSRRDGLHKLSADIAHRFSHIAMEDLNIKGLAGGMLAKSVHNASWGTLTKMIAYKAEKAGGVVALVNPRGTSQTCPECGTVVAKTLRVREHNCECGCVLDRDVAAARVVLHRADFPDGTSGQTPSQRNAA